MSRARFSVLLIVGLIGFLAGFTPIARRHAQPKLDATPALLEEPDPAFVYRVELGEAPVRGPANARITVVVFSTYDCERCRQVEASLARLSETHSLRIAWKDVPATPERSLAARSARAAGGQGKFWELHDRLARLKSIDEATVSREAQAAGLDVPRLMAALHDPELAKIVAADGVEAHRFGLNTAPGIFVNGRFVKDPTLEHLRAQVEEAEAFVTQLVADGTPQEKIYSALMRGALPQAGPISLESLK